MNNNLTPLSLIRTLLCGLCFTFLACGPGADSKSTSASKAKPAEAPRPPKDKEKLNQKQIEEKCAPKKKDVKEYEKCVKDNTPPPEVKTGDDKKDADDTAASASDIGFLKIDNQEVTNEVRDLDKSVYKVLIPSGKSKIAKSEGEETIKKLSESTKTERDAAREQAKIDTLQSQNTELEKCLAQAKTECIYFENSTAQTGFMVYNDKSFATSLEVVAEYIKISNGLGDKKKMAEMKDDKLKELIASAQVAATVIDKDGQIIIDGNGQIKVSEKSYDKVFRKIKGSTLADVENVVILTSESGLTGSPLKFSETKAEKSEESEKSEAKIFALGYPVTSTDRKSKDKTDANGKDLSATKGSLVADASKVFKTLGFSKTISSVDQIKYVAATADSNSGMMGGPMVNEHGELVGVVVVTGKEDSNDKANLTKRGTIGRSVSAGDL